MEPLGPAFATLAESLAALHAELSNPDNQAALPIGTFIALQRQIADGLLAYYFLARDSLSLEQQTTADAAITRAENYLREADRLTADGAAARVVVAPLRESLPALWDAWASLERTAGRQAL